MIVRRTQLGAKRSDGVQSVNDAKVISVNVDSDEAVIQCTRESSVFPDFAHIKYSHLCAASNPSFFRLKREISVNVDSNEAVVRWTRGSSVLPDIESIPYSHLYENAGELNCLFVQCSYNSSS